MPFFGTSQFDQAVVKATSEHNITEDWETIMNICDKVQVTPNGSKDCLRSIVKRLNSNVPHHTIHALTLLDACISNCGKKFHLEVCSHDFELELKKLLTKGHRKIAEKLKMYLKKWSEDFKNDPELSLIPSLYNSLKLANCENHSIEVETSKSSSQKPKDSNAEEEDLAKAIELSLKTLKNTSKTNKSLYPNFSSVSNSVPALKMDKKEPQQEEPRKVRALYDFVAAEDNELTFKTGELLFVIDASDRNWWKGSNHRGEGLFPSNFVTSDLNMKTEWEENKVHENKKSVTFDEVINVKTLDTPREADEVVIDEAKMERMLELLHEADPTGQQPDSVELLNLEENCSAMGPLIYEELIDIDRRMASLTAGNNCLVDALNAYEALMKDYSMSYPPYHASSTDVMQGYHSPPQQHAHSFGASTYLPPETYQSLPVPTSSEHFQVPVAGALPVLQSRMIQGGQPHISYGAGTTNLNIPQGSVASTGGNFATSLPSREPSGIYYTDVVANSIQHNPTSLSMQHQPML